MQTLNLSGEQKKTDGRFKSLFWPTVENAWDVDYLGQQGFWICLVISVLSTVFIVITAFELPNPVARATLLALSAVIFFVYVIGGMGVRESSWPAAALIFVLYVVNQLGSGGPPGVLAIIAGAVLLSNVRATFLASRWQPVTEGEDRPMRFNETMRDKLVDQMPPRLWPVFRIPFFVVSSLLLAFLIHVSAVTLNRGRHASIDENALPLTTVTAAPPDGVGGH
jgi:hypothetical protein